MLRQEDCPDATSIQPGGPSPGDRAGTKVKQLAATFQMSEATVYSWLKQERVDRGEAEGATTGQQLELAAARRRMRQLETKLAVARKVNEVFLSEGVAPKA